MLSSPPEWVRYAIWWQVYPLGALSAERSALPTDSPAVPRLRALHGWLDHLLDLGCNGLALGPVFESETHGYDTVDHLRVDRRLGTESDLIALIDACHARGIRVLLDGVFNHVGRGFAPFGDVVERGRHSAAASWFHLDSSLSGPDGFGYRTFEGHQHLVTLNHASEDVIDHVTRVMTYWCDRGVDAWRLDAAYAVPAEFWSAVLPRVRASHPELWTVGEMIHGDYVGYLRASGIDAVTQYELWKAVWSSLNDRNLFELAHALRRHADLVRHSLPQTFIGNHDVTRIASRLTDSRHLEHAIALLCLLPGIPTVYYGDEWAANGIKEDRAGGDDAIRPPLPTDAASPTPHARSTTELYQRLIGIRRRHAWLVDATIHEPDVLTNDLLCVRLSAGEDVLALALNLGDAPATLAKPFQGATLIGGHGAITTHSDGQFEVPVHSVAVLAT